MTQTPFAQPPYRQLRRPVTDRMVAGVASGFGRYFDVDPTLVRVLFAAAVILTGGLALLAYPVMWFLMPAEPADAAAWPHPPATAHPATARPAAQPTWLNPPAAAHPAEQTASPHRPTASHPAEGADGPAEPGPR